LPLDAPGYGDKPKRKGRRSNNASPEFAQPDRTEGLILGASTTAE
jgi:hypothetical protein